MQDIEQKALIGSVLQFLNSTNDNPYILKGGTALMECYGLDRPSEDIDLDAPGNDYALHKDRLFSEIEQYCQASGCTFRVAKDTPTVQRALLHQGESNRPLKIELSFRRLDIPTTTITEINGIKVYDLDSLCQMKTAAYLSRDKIRDLYDITFICDKYFDRLSDDSKTVLRNAFEYKDLSQLDYLLETQDDPLIDKDMLETRFLETFEKVGLMISA